MKDSIRQEALLDLIRLRMPVDEAIRSLRRFPWDSEALVQLRAVDVENLLDAYERGELLIRDVVAWAGAIEVRDDIDLEPEAESELREFLFEVSTPEINQVFDVNRAADRRRRMCSLSSEGDSNTELSVENDASVESD